MATVLSVPRLTIGRAALAQLRLVLERETPAEAAQLLREIGFSAGPAAHDGFVEWCSARYGVESPRGLDSRYLSEAVGGFFRDEGWGSATTELLAPGVLAFDSPDWAEAEPRGAEYPCCHFSAGMLSDFFTRLSGQPAAVLEVECRATGGARCRYLIGSPALMTWMYEGIAEGAGYQDMVGRIDR